VLGLRVIAAIEAPFVIRKIAYHLIHRLLVHPQTMIPIQRRISTRCSWDCDRKEWA
jgi:hypothetical protein